ncbi:sensor histidine kinase [Actinomadura barringtoniae]|uniref:histidine kinase n=1 Tax=Actinomadura barringtoniae TaxID=1427535 RepID=A0A939P5Y3_9ACTN|nr:histidine kinase [Actinomadura barringtoniae]MBO2445850.1 sensor histidine kinase [Actinomadura barringtoniae]
MGRRWETAAIVDAAVALVVAVATATAEGGGGRAIGDQNITYVDWNPPLWFAIPFGLAAGAVAWRRRRWPASFVAVALAVWVVMAAFGALMIAQYTLADRTTSWWKTLVSTVVTASVVGVPIWVRAGPDAALPLSAGICVAPALLGLYVGTRRELIAGIRERAARAEREHEQRVLRARGEERAQIARDMHDVVTHRVSLMVLHATALEATQGRDAVAIGRRIGSIGRAALGELRSLVEVLREDGAVPLAPQPGLADLEALAAESRRLGLPVTLDLPHVPEVSAPALVEHAVYRVVQEALTNVHKHGGSTAHVSVRRTDGALRLRVTNEGGRPAGPELPGGGHGLIGVSERIRLVGGELTARPTGGGFEVAADIPLKPERTEPERTEPERP